MMTQWFVKDLSKLTGVSVQTLHHYDRIGLLKPSLRQANGYRVYSEKDLLQLQQIIALKFFGFELNQIKALLTDKQHALQHFATQAEVLEKQAAALSAGAKTLRGVIDTVDSNQSIPWETIIRLIEVYKMAEHLEHDWVKDIFTPEELTEYVAFEKELKATNKTEFQQQWRALLAEWKKNLHEAPESPVGIETGRNYMTWVNEVYGQKYAHLRTKKWEQGFGDGKGLDEIGMTTEEMAWLEKAVDAYWKDRLYDILNQVGKSPASSVLTLWNKALDDMYGEETARKKAVYEVAMNDNKVSPEAKAWLKSLP